MALVRRGVFQRFEPLDNFLFRVAKMLDNEILAGRLTSIGSVESLNVGRQRREEGAHSCALRL